MPDLAPIDPAVLRALAWIVGACGVGLAAEAVVFRLLRAGARRWPQYTPGQGHLTPLRAPLRLVVPLAAVLAVRPDPPPWPAGVEAAVRVGLHVTVVVAVAWLLLRGLVVAERLVTARYPTEGDEATVRARRIVTQTRLVRRVLSVVLGVVAGGVALYAFEPFRTLAAGLLASAGLLGIIVGIAAQPTLGNLVAGLQIAFTQPMRVDDVVIVEGEFGWIEEITLTYVVVRVWDQRRVVLPITYFVDRPFQNWTRSSSELLGTVFLHVDYATDVPAVRAEVTRLAEASAWWDGRVAGLMVTDATERTVQLRATVSASSAPRLWELRCEVREGLLAFLRDHHPGSLPTVRAHLRDADPATTRPWPTPPDVAAPDAKTSDVETPDAQEADPAAAPSS